MDETKLLNYLKGESDAEECLEVEAWYHASAEHKKQLDQLYYMLFVGEGGNGWCGHRKFTKRFEGPDKAQRVREKISA